MTEAPPKRRPPTRDERQAAAYLMITRGDGTPIIDREEAKKMTAKEIVSEFEKRVQWHHEFEHALGGGMHPTMITPLATEEHKAIPSTSRVAKSKRITAEHEDFRRRILAKSGQAEPVERQKSKLKSAGFQGWRKFDGTPVKRGGR